MKVPLKLGSGLRLEEFWGKAGNMNIKGDSGEVSDGNEEHIIENWKEGNACYKVEKNLAELCLCSSVLWKLELVSSKTGYLTQKIYF